MIAIDVEKSFYYITNNSLTFTVQYNTALRMTNDTFWELSTNDDHYSTTISPGIISKIMV